MEAPDKIYLHPDDRHWWHEGNKTDDRFVEYICKDVLMEWIQEVRAIPHENAITRDLAFQEVVNKLNSM